jgi:hypothetical protein
MAGTNKKAVELGFYPISISYVRSLIANCEKWEYDNNATCKYVAETVIEKLERENPELDILDSLYSDLVSIAHKLNNGRTLLRIKIPFKK